MNTPLPLSKLLLLSLTLLLLQLPSANAGGMLERGGIEFHYSAFGSTFLTPTVATNYDIQRSRYNGVVNISVLDPDADFSALAGQMSGTATNLLGNKKPLEFREIREGKAIYYIAEFGFSNEETFTFKLQFLRNGKTYDLNFRQIFYAD